MKAACSIAVAVGLLTTSALAASDPKGVAGDYVEVRTAQVYAGGCIMGSEGEAAGREAILAWRVSRGAVDGVTLDGLSIVAAATADNNLGTHDLGGAPANVLKSVVLVDERANTAQRQALVAMARSLAPSIVRSVVETRAVPIAFERKGESVRVHAAEASLDVVTNVPHSPNCGALKWFEPLARTENAEVGVTLSQEWSGTALGPRWKQVSDDKRSSFVGTFSYAGR
jgi:hypothetical protein